MSKGKATAPSPDQRECRYQWDSPRPLPLSPGTGWGLKRARDKLHVNDIFKASYDKANRTSAKSFRGPGIQAGLKVLARVRAEIGVPVLTDVHTEEQARVAAEVVRVADTGVSLPANGPDFNL